MSAQQTRIAPPTTSAPTPSKPRAIDPDLIALVIASALVPLVPLIPVALARVPLGLLVALGLPGYALVVALFPDRRSLDRMTRMALSFGLSIAVIPILTMILSALPWGIRPWPIAMSLSIWTLALTAAAIWRRRVTDMPALPLIEEPPEPPPPSTGSRSIERYVLFGGTMLGVVAIAFVSGWFIHPAAQPTEFYVLGSDGRAENYPRQVTTADKIELTAGIISHETSEVVYSVEVWAVDGSGSSAPAVLATAEPISLQPGESREFPISFQMPMVGVDQQVDIVLFQDGDADPYRRLTLWIDVVEEP